MKIFVKTQTGNVSAVKVVDPDVERTMELLSALAHDLRSLSDDDEFHDPLTNRLDMVDALGWFGQRWFDFQRDSWLCDCQLTRGIKYAGREVLAPAVPHFVELLGDPHPKVRQLGAWCLAGAGHDAEAATPQLAATLDDPDNDVQAETLEALQILCRFSPEQVLPILIRKLNHSSVSPITRRKRDQAASIIDGLLAPHALGCDVPRFKEPIAGAAAAVVPELWRIARQPLTDGDDRRAHDSLKLKARRSLKSLQPEELKRSQLEELAADWDAREEEHLLSRLREAKEVGEALREARYSALKDLAGDSEELVEVEKIMDAKRRPRGDADELPFPAPFDPAALREAVHADGTALVFVVEGEAAWACLPCGVVGSSSCDQEEAEGERGSVEDGPTAGASGGATMPAASKSQAAAICSGGGGTERDAASAVGAAAAAADSSGQAAPLRRRQRRWWRGETRRRRHFLNADGFTHQRARFWCAFSTHYFERLSHLEGGDPFHQWTRSPRDPMPSQDLEGFFDLRARRKAAARATKPPREGGELTDGPRRGRPYPRCFAGPYYPVCFAGEEEEAE